MSTEPKKRLIDPTRKTMADLKITEVSPEQVLQDALTTASIEVTRYRTRVSSGQTLNTQEARIVQGWIKCMTDVMKEVREQEKASRLEDLTNDQLVELAKKMLSEQGRTLELEPNVEPDETDQE